MPKTQRAQDTVDQVNATTESELSAWTLEETLSFGGAPLFVLRLGNGLRVLLLPDDSAKVVSYFTWFRVGSRHEKPGKTGLAHLFEHLMFNETEGLKAGEFDRKLEENGAESNAATWLDWTYYYEALPSDRFGLAVTLESERMARLVLREPQITSEKEVVANERRYRVEDDVEGAANELLYKHAFQKHAYHWPTIGWMDDIKNFTPEDCAAFYKTYYAPNNATLVVVGDVKLKDALTKIRDAYGKLAAAALPVEDTTPEPFQLEERRIEVKKPTASEKVILGYRGPALGDNDHPTLVVLSEILFGGRASRLYERLVIEKELVTDLRGWASTFRDPGLFEMFFYARGEHTCEEILTALEPELARLHVDVVSEEELTRAKARLELGLLSTLDTASGKAEQMGFYDTVLGDPVGAFGRLAAYRRVSAGDIRTAARRYLHAAQRTMVIVRRDGAPSETAESAEAAQ